MMTTSRLDARPGVATDRAGWPREIRSAGGRSSITAVEAVRDETAAYPLGSGPRRVYVVRTDGRRFRLVQRVREDCWTVEEIAPQGGRLRSVA